MCPYNAIKDGESVGFTLDFWDFAMDQATEHWENFLTEIEVQRFKRRSGCRWLQIAKEPWHVSLRDQNRNWRKMGHPGAQRADAEAALKVWRVGMELDSLGNRGWKIHEHPRTRWILLVKFM